MNEEELAQIRFYQTAPHACSYLEGEEAITIFMDPEVELNKALYSRLINGGFRRSASHLYRPGCPQCSACISSRVRTREFERSKRFQRVWKRNDDLEVKEAKSVDSPELYELYARYINTRHKDGDMYPADQEQYQGFIQAKSCTTRFFVFYLDQRPIAACVTDVLDHGLSAMYSFFDPDLDKRSLGTYMILWQIEQAKAMNLPYLYLGYWIKESAKMSYKTQYRPLELLINGQWALLT
ncbi:MAG: arginyltransferase [Pseudohongiellaceae bacterium]|nr:arginyltransferase [Pseudohongiellaceae bacterium]